MDEYTCVLCHGTFIKGRPDEEAWAEHLARDPDVVEKEDTGIVCDNCFEHVMAVREGRACPIRRRVKVVAVKSHTVRSACTAARRVLGLKLDDSREVFRSGGEDGLWRVYLQDGTIVECTIVARAKTEVFHIDAG